MRKKIHYIGNRFGDLVVVGRSEKKTPRNESRYICLCDCGNEVDLSPDALRKGASNCGCKRKPHPIKHGLSNHSLYDTWRKMVDRCHNSKSGCYCYYGGRGISVCDRWRNDVSLFIIDIERYLGDKPDKSYTLDRIDNNGDYEIGNVKWSSRREQNCNKNKMNNTTSRYPGVHYKNKSQKWEANIKDLDKNKTIYLGVFELEEEAYKVYRNAYIKMRGKEPPNPVE